MRRRTFLVRLLVSGLSLAVVHGGRSAPALSAETVCPKCGAPVEPGALFCGRCGQKLETAPVAETGGTPKRATVVQVVTAHDNELTSTYGSLNFESNLRVDSVLGSAFAIAPGEFVTDGGLLVGAKEVSLRTSSGRSIPAKVVGSDAMIGIALLKADLTDVNPLSLRLEEPPGLGERLEALGFPSGVQSVGEPVVSAGVLSGLHRGSAGIHPVEDYLQTDASLPRGFAGGPLLDARGRVVGMNTGQVFGSQVQLGPESGIGYAVPAEWIERALAWIRAGAAPRAWMGAYTVPADSESRGKYKLPSHVKLLIDQIFPGSPAAATDLRRGDGLLRIQGVEISTLSDLHRRLLSARVGDRIDLDLIRGSEPLHVTVALAVRPDRPRLSGLDALRFFGDLDIVSADSDRLVVASVAPGSEAAHFRVAPGDVLQSVLSKKDWVHGAKDNSRWRSVHTPADLEARIETAYSDLDFCLGLRFRSRDGTKREILVCEILTPTAAL